MKKNFIAALILFACCGSLTAQQEEIPTVNTPIITEDVLPAGWYKDGNNPQDYTVGLDYIESFSGKASAFIKANPGLVSGFAELKQELNADNYRGDRVRLSGYLKVEMVTGWAGMWMRVQDRNGDDLCMDNMENRPVKGSSDWIKYSIVLDVPAYGEKISFGLLLKGKGQVWMDNLLLERVAEDVPVTNQLNNEKSEEKIIPQNMDFEKQ
ncbi:MAG TPA: hypothetical protein VMT35_06425 [Ignavibacteriaceae bacterium]|nr:hypothetical protein [Ignavibacteriaceae bacterium]